MVGARIVVCTYEVENLLQQAKSLRVSDAEIRTDNNMTGTIIASTFDVMEGANDARPPWTVEGRAERAHRYAAGVNDTGDGGVE